MLIQCYNNYYKNHHTIVRYNLYNSDYIYINALSKAPDLAKQMNVHSPSGEYRSQERREAMTFAGYIAEQLVMDMINDILINIYKVSGIYAHPVDFDKNKAINGGSFSQVDLAVTNSFTRKSVTIEVRSSIVKKSILRDNNVYNYDQSLIGSYSTGNKSSEDIKDFYITVLFRSSTDMFTDESGKHIPNWRIIDSIKKQKSTIIADIAGCASKYLLYQLGQHDNLDQNGADYLNIKPIVKSNSIYDIVSEIYNMVI